MGAPRKDIELLDEELMRRFPPSDRYLVAVSGGRDSVALLESLLQRGYRKLIVCHLDHRLRGRSSAADARFVRKLAEQSGLDSEVAEADVRGFAKEHRQSIETAARAVRYAYFVDVARRRRCRTIFLAHHADDLVETFLFNLFRGSARRSMRSVSLYSLGKTSLTIIRPMLHRWREEIDDYIRAAGLRFREDASNARLDRARNRMRHKIIPWLEKEFGRGIRKSLWRAAMIAAEEDALLESMLPPNDEKLRVHSLGKQQLPLQRRVVRNWLRAHGIADVGFEVIERVRSLLDAGNRPAKVNLPGDRHARRRAGQLFIE